MANSLIVTGIKYNKDENCVMSFFRAKMKLTQDVPIKSARRIDSGPNKSMLIELVDTSRKGLIYSDVSNLKDERNPDGYKFFVNDHLPEELHEKCKKMNQMVAENKKKSGIKAHVVIVKV